MKCEAASVVPTTSIVSLDDSWRGWQTRGHRVSFRMGVCHELPKHFLGCWAECSVLSLPSAFSCLWANHVLWNSSASSARMTSRSCECGSIFCCRILFMVPTFAFTRGSTPDSASFWFDDGDSYCAGGFVVSEINLKLTSFQNRQKYFAHKYTQIVWCLCCCIFTYTYTHLFCTSTCKHCDGCVMFWQ